MYWFIWGQTLNTNSKHALKTYWTWKALCANQPTPDQISNWMKRSIYLSIYRGGSHEYDSWNQNIEHNIVIPWQFKSHKNMIFNLVWRLDLTNLISIFSQELIYMKKKSYANFGILWNNILSIKAAQVGHVYGMILFETNLSRTNV